jgi:hypothetical protein
MAQSTFKLQLLKSLALLAVGNLWPLVSHLGSTTRTQFQLERCNVPFIVEVGLQLDHLPVSTASRHQLGMSSDLDDATLVHDDDLIRAGDRTQPMGDYEGCSPLHQALQA